MIYVDTSVLIATVLSEERQAPDWLWEQDVVSSRLAEYEVWNRLNTSGAGAAERDAAFGLLGRVDLIGLTPEVLARALDPFPRRVKTFDALHLATAEFLRSNGSPVQFATYDGQQRAAAMALQFELADI